MYRVTGANRLKLFDAVQYAHEGAVTFHFALREKSLRSLRSNGPGSFAVLVQEQLCTCPNFAIFDHR
jgi:hypothetical protein